MLHLGALLAGVENTMYSSVFEVGVALEPDARRRARGGTHYSKGMDIRGAVE